MSLDIITAQDQSIVTAQPELQPDMVNRFIRYLDASEKTVQTYTRALKQMWLYFSVHSITHPQREDIIAFRDDLKASGHKPTTVQNYIIAVRLFFRWTASEGIYPNVADHITGAKLDRGNKKDYLTSAQVKDILIGIERNSEKGKRDYAMLLLMITCGLRTIEVSRADIGDLRTVADFTAIYIQGKGKSEKTEFVRVQPEVEKALRDYLKTRNCKAASAPLFASTSRNNYGKRMTTRSVSAIAKERMQDAGYDSERLTAHSLRHTAVTLSLLEGKDITEVQQFARHANLTTTMIYAHHLDKTKNGCSEAITNAILR